MAKLTTKRRNALSSSSFALPGRRYPIEDLGHARNALARVSQHGSPEEKQKVRAAVHRKYPEIGKQNHELAHSYRDGATEVRGPKRAYTGTEPAAQPGAYPSYAAGRARVPGKGDGDHVRALLEPGEAVLSRKGAERIGRHNIAKANGMAAPPGKTAGYAGGTPCVSGSMETRRAGGEHDHEYDHMSGMERAMHAHADRLHKHSGLRR